MTVPLRALDASPVRVRIPGSGTDVELVRLHLDRGTKATVSLVRFPPSWRRPGTGHYPCAEELLVLDGAFAMSGVTYAAGDYGYLPPFATRSESASPDGCLALAWFSGVPTWMEGDAPGRVEHPAVHRRGLGSGGWHRPARPDVPGSSFVADNPPAAVEAPTELVYPDGWRWALVVPGVPVPALPGPVFVRRWA